MQAVDNSSNKGLKNTILTLRFWVNIFWNWNLSERPEKMSYVNTKEIKNLLKQSTKVLNRGYFFLLTNVCPLMRIYENLAEY